MPSYVNTIVLHGKSDDEVASLMNQYVTQAEEKGFLLRKGMADPVVALADPVADMAEALAGMADPVVGMADMAEDMAADKNFNQPVAKR